MCNIIGCTELEIHVGSAGYLASSMLLATFCCQLHAMEVAVLNVVAHKTRGNYLWDYFVPDWPVEAPRKSAWQVE